MSVRDARRNRSSLSAKVSDALAELADGCDALAAGLRAVANGTGGPEDAIDLVCAMQEALAATRDLVVGAAFVDAALEDVDRP